MNSDTLAAYLATRYRVFTEPAIDLRIGERSDAMVALLARHDVESAVFVTAFNPFSRPASDAGNATRQRALAARLAHLGLTTIAGAGIDPTGRWPAEESLLALGANRAAADALMVEFEQNAVVFVDRDGCAQLLMHPALRKPFGADEVTQDPPAR